MSFSRLLHPTTRTGWAARLGCYIGGVVAVVIVVQLLAVSA